MNPLEKTLRKIARELLLPLRSESRHILERKIFPKIKNKKVLLVGCAPYTREYPKKLKNNDLWTIDINSDMKIFGAKQHIVGNVADINDYFQKNSFDIIIFFGVFGYGLNEINEAEKTMLNFHKVLKKTGLLILLWTNRKGCNPIKPRLLKNFNLYKPITFLGYPSGYQTKNKGVYEFLIPLK
jgi:SAM-dependent methyltransferase